MNLSGKDLIKITWWPVLIASLCCLAPVILVLLGLSTAAFAVSLTDILYGQYRWMFRSVGLVLLVASLAIYLRRHQGICTLDDVRRRRNEVINISMMVLMVGVIGYVVWLYGAVELLGIGLGLW